MNDEPKIEEPAVPIGDPVPPPRPELRRKRGWPAGRNRRPQSTFEMLRDELKLQGMTTGVGWNSACPDACNPQDGCIITRRGGSGICAHPDKTGLQAADLNRPQIKERYDKVRKFLAHLKVDRH